eukprot:scaffold34105_cov36-Prasinocladus_malaysianus.AAC.1
MQTIGNEDIRRRVHMANKQYQANDNNTGGLKLILMEVCYAEMFRVSFPEIKGVGGPHWRQSPMSKLFLVVKFICAHVCGQKMIVACPRHLTTDICAQCLTGRRDRGRRSPGGLDDCLAVRNHRPPAAGGGFPQPGGPGCGRHVGGVLRRAPLGRHGSQRCDLARHPHWWCDLHGVGGCVRQAAGPRALPRGLPAIQGIR